MSKNTERFKYCFVPGCKSTTIRTPDKFFFTVPRHERDKWFAMARRQPDAAKTSAFFCCEDHLDLENDVSNLLEHKLTGRRPKLKPGVMPRKFDCQLDRKQAQSIKERPLFIKRKRLDLLSICLQNVEDNGGTKRSKEDRSILPTAEIKEPLCNKPSTSADTANEEFILPHEEHSWTTPDRTVNTQFTLSYNLPSPNEPEPSNCERIKNEQQTKPRNAVKEGVEDHNPLEPIVEIKVEPEDYEPNSSTPADTSNKNLIVPILQQTPWKPPDSSAKPQIILFLTNFQPPTTSNTCEQLKIMPNSSDVLGTVVKEKERNDNSLGPTHVVKNKEPPSEHIALEQFILPNQFKPWATPATIVQPQLTLTVANSASPNEPEISNCEQLIKKEKTKQSKIVETVVKKEVKFDKLLEPTVIIKEEPADYNTFPSTFDDMHNKELSLTLEKNSQTIANTAVKPQSNLTSTKDPGTCNSKNVKTSSTDSKVPPQRLDNKFGDLPHQDSLKEYRKDQFDAFGEYIASRLRILDREPCALAKKAIQHVILEAEMGKYLNQTQGTKS